MFVELVYQVRRKTPPFRAGRMSKLTPLRPFTLNVNHLLIEHIFSSLVSGILKSNSLKRIALVTHSLATSLEREMVLILRT